MGDFVTGGESPDFLKTQLITYLGNKRSLLDFIKRGIEEIQSELGVRKFSVLDTFSGSGIVSRFFKQYASVQYANDMECYARIISSCYLKNACDIDLDKLSSLYKELLKDCDSIVASHLDSTETSFYTLPDGFVSLYYAPKDINDIQKGERCFYTPYNACYIDVMRRLIEEKVPLELRDFFIAPLLSEASIHANTGGIFKGFYKDSKTGLGKFGGNESNALTRIKGRIRLPFPIFSVYTSNSYVLQRDANALVHSVDSPAVDVAYIDPPYNQHPYGSNYFMLNLIATNTAPTPERMSRVSGIPKDWNRSLYNKRRHAQETFIDLVEHINARYLLISFNNEGFISSEAMFALLSKVGTVKILESTYNTFRASRNLSARALHTKEYLYVVKKN